MGWKSTITLTREECIKRLKYALENLEEKDNEILTDMLEAYCGGEKYGHNFQIEECVWVNAGSPRCFACSDYDGCNIKGKLHKEVQ